MTLRVLFIYEFGMIVRLVDNDLDSRYSVDEAVS